MTRIYLAVEDGEILFEVEAESRAGAQWLADMTVWGDMHESHHRHWNENGVVMTRAEYDAEYGKPPNEAAIMY